MHHGSDFFRRAGLQGGGIDFVGSVHFFVFRYGGRVLSQGSPFYRERLAESG